MKYKYSKSSEFYLNTKCEFFIENQRLLDQATAHNQTYALQPIRSACKICASRLPLSIDLHSHGIDYVFCAECSHLNGVFEDSQEFIEKLYIKNEGADYSQNYIDKDFQQRTNDIYLPKVDFLINTLRLDNINILDVGCGSGYFVLAARQRNLSATGLDVSKTMVDFGNKQISYILGESPLFFADEQGFYQALISSDANIISAIGVIEHLREPYKFFEAFQKCNAQYLYYSVPMFSFSALIENVFKEVFPRQLSSGHTHLFTEQSLKSMNEIIGVKSLAEWRFGTDTMDLYRHIATMLKKNGSSSKIMDYFNYGFGKKIDEIQSIFDKSHFCSEIHCVTQKTKVA